jgi:hypothetical protein
MRKGNLFFLILMVSIFAFSLYALEKQGAPLVKKEKSLLSSEKGGEKGVSGCCKEEGVPLAAAPAQKPAGLQAKGEKKAPSKGEEAPAGKASNKKPQPAKAPSSDVKLEKESEKKDISPKEEEEEGEEEEEEFEEYSDDESGPEEDEDTDFSGY